MSPASNVTYTMLDHKFIYVVVVAIILRVDGVEPSCAPHPLPQAYPTLTERSKPGAVAMELVRIVEVHALNHMLNGSNASNEIVMFADGCGGRVILNTVECVRHRSQYLLWPCPGG